MELNYADLAVAIQHCLAQVARQPSGSHAKDWALAAAVLLDKEDMLRRTAIYDRSTSK